MAVLQSPPFNPSMTLVLAVVTFLVVNSILASVASDLPLDPGFSDITTLNLYPEPTSSDDECKGTIAECWVVGDTKEDDEIEFAMDLETNRRMLAATWYISYGALWRNVIPCSRRGMSYYNCHSGTQVNPYTRGCSQITRCRG